MFGFFCRLKKLQPKLWETAQQKRTATPTPTPTGEFLPVWPLLPLPAPRLQPICAARIPINKALRQLSIIKLRPLFIRSDRRSLAGLSMMPSAPSNPSNAAVSKHRYGGRKLVPNARTGSIAETDWRSNNLSVSENDVQARIANSNTFEMRGESHPNSGLKRRTLSATTLRTVQDLAPSAARINPRLNVANYASMTGSQTNLASQCGAVPYATAQQYMCSMYALPNTKVTQQQQSVMNLSVISGPAPVTYRPDPTGQVGTTQQAGLRGNNLPSHRLTTTGSSALR